MASGSGDISLVLCSKFETLMVGEDILDLFPLLDELPPIELPRSSGEDGGKRVFFPPFGIPGKIPGDDEVDTAKEQGGQYVRKADVKWEPPNPPFSLTQNQDFSQLTSRIQNSSYDDTPTCRSIGIQTEEPERPANYKFSSKTRQKKLLSIWNSPTGISELVVDCQEDLKVLWGYLNSSSNQSPEDKKVSKLYHMMTKIGTGWVKLDDLLGALVDLCRLDNVVILYRSLCVFHKALTHVTRLDAGANRRDNVIVKQPSSGDYTAESPGLEKLHRKEAGTHGYTPSTSSLDWTSVFTLMSHIAAKDIEECIRLKAVSIMNSILLKTNAYLERERFGRVLGLQSISQFLGEGCGAGVQKEALHLLYLLLNCPKLMDTFCSGCQKELDSIDYMELDARHGSSVQKFGPLLEGLAGCVACGGNSMLELELRRKSVTVLAFLASSELGLKIFLAQGLLKKTSYLELILQMLASEMDAEVRSISETSEILKERTLLIRDALKFLDQLVSNPLFSTVVLEVLTSTRDTAYLVVTIATTLSNNPKPHWQCDDLTRQMKLEIADLATVFRKRISKNIQNKFG